VTALVLSPTEYAQAEKFGMHVPLGADDGIRYTRGDTDPTSDDTDLRFCSLYGGLYDLGCTWPVGHTHPQHVAGGTRGFVLDVWDVEPAAPSVEKRRVLTLLQQQETLAREGAERIRASYAFAPKPQRIAEALMEEARAGAFASAVEIVEQVAF